MATKAPSSPYFAIQGERYRSTLFDDDWLAARGIDIRPAEETIETFFETGRFSAALSRIAF